MKQLKLEFKPAFAILVTILCFTYFFLIGVDNGIMVLASFAVKHYFDSTASSIANTREMLAAKKTNQPDGTDTP